MSAIASRQSLALKLLGYVALALAGLLMWSSAQSGATPGGPPAATFLGPLVEEEPVAAFATRQVCTLLGGNQLQADILGQDGGKSIVHDGVSYWSFGDTKVDLNGNGVWDGLGIDTQLPNSVAYSSGFDPTTCLKLTSKVDQSGRATALLPKITFASGTEQTVWPTGWVQPDAGAGSIYFYYVSISPTGSPGPVQGVGLAEMTVSDLDDLESTRVAASGTQCTTVANCLFWKTSDAPGGTSCGFDIDGASPMREGDWVYIYFETDGGADVRLARVTFSAIENVTAYEYWSGSGWVTNSPCSMVPLWNQQGYPLNGLVVSDNQYLGKYLAVYVLSLSDVSARVADDPWGPWIKGEQVSLVKCDQFLPSPQPGSFLCYGGNQHPHLERGGGQILYVAYSNSETYRVYIQEVVLGTPIFLYQDGAGNTAYRREGVAGPSGFSQKGVAFYAYYDNSECTDPALQDVYTSYSIVRVYEWFKVPAEYLYTTNPTTPPATGYVYQGVAYCARNVPGLYDVSQPFGTGYRFCKASVETDYKTRVFCYTDGLWVVNQLDSPGVTGDGLPGGGLDGGGPWWPAIPPVGAPEDYGAGECARYNAIDEDGDTVVNDGCPGEGFADVDSSHTKLVGTLDTGTNTLRLAGCFKDEDASEALGYIYVEWSWNVQTGTGTSDTWTSQNPGDCTGSHTWGTYSGVAGVPTFASMPLAALKRPMGPMGEDPDSDGDGIPDVVELRDEAGGGGSNSNCGGRDPFNPYDWYDVNQDGVIDLVNDILGVIDHWQPTAGGAPPYDITYDRPATMTGALGHWNRGAPDGVIDLLNDILGVTDQWHPTAC